MDNLDLSDFLLIFLSFVYGYVVTVYLAGWSSMIHDKNGHRYYWVHSFWTIIGFLFTVQAWWGLWPDRIGISENFLTFLLSLAVPVQLYFLVTFLLPVSENSKGLNFKFYFMKNRKYVFTLAVMLLATMIMNSLVFKGEEVWSDKNVFRFVGLFLLLSLIFVKNRWFQEAAPFILLAVLGSYVGLHRFEII